jgi:hypothetical protein
MMMNYENTLTISLPGTKDVLQESTPSGYESQQLSEYSANSTPNGPSTFFSYDVSGIPSSCPQNYFLNVVLDQNLIRIKLM